MENENLDDYSSLKDWHDNYSKDIEFENLVKINVDISCTKVFIENDTEELKKYKSFSKDYKRISKRIFQQTKILNELNLKLENLFQESELKNSLESIRHFFKIKQAHNEGNLGNLSIGERLICEHIGKYAVKLSHKNISSQGGKVAAKNKQDELEARNKRIAKQAQILLDNGKERKDLSGILAKQFDLTSRQINNILKAAKI